MSTAPHIAERKPLVTPKQAAAYLQLPLTTVQDYAKSGELPAVRLGRHWRFRQEDLDSRLVPERKGVNAK